MQKLKEIFPKNIFSTKESTKTISTGRLETDALPVPDNNNDDDNDNANLQNNNIPTVSEELTESTVRALSDPNYNSNELVGANSTALVNNNHSLNEYNGNDDYAITSANAAGPTMNVNNAQQQVVMQFSNVSKLHFGSVYNFNSNITASNSRKSSCADEGAAAIAAQTDSKRSTPRKTTTIVEMMQSQVEPNHRMLDTIATHLGEGWKQVMRELGLSDGQIEQAVINHQMHGGIKEVIYQLLLQWIQDADDDNVATMGSITTLLWRLNHRECVNRMKIVWKSIAVRKTSR